MKTDTARSAPMSFFGMWAVCSTGEGARPGNARFSPPSGGMGRKSDPPAGGLVRGVIGSGRPALHRVPGGLVPAPKGLPGPDAPQREGEGGDPEESSGSDQRGKHHYVGRKASGENPHPFDGGIPLPLQLQQKQTGGPGDGEQQ